MKKITKNNKNNTSIINNNKPINTIINNKKVEESNILIDFSLFYFPSINCKFFTNKLKTEEEYIKAMSSFYHRTLFFLSSQTFSMLEKINPHCHIIRSSEEAFDRIVKVLKKYKETFPEFKFYNIEDETDEFYQLCGQNGLRLIGKRINSIFVLLFIDFHHLIYPDDKFNKDYKNYNFLENEVYTGNINILNIDDCISDKCLECEELKI